MNYTNQSTLPFPKIHNLCLTAGSKMIENPYSYQEMMTLLRKNMEIYGTNLWGLTALRAVLYHVRYKLYLANIVPKKQ